MSAQTNSQNICLIPQTLTQNIHGGRPTTLLSRSSLLTADELGRRTSAVAAAAAAVTRHLTRRRRVGEN